MKQPIGAPPPPGQGSVEGEPWALSSAAIAGEPPTSLLIAPWGEVASANGSFVVDEEAGRSVGEAFAAHGTDLPIDYEHQTLGGAYASPTGQAPAAGWIKALRAIAPQQGQDSPPGLYADVEWTEGARAKLLAREYRYVSPVVLVRRSDRRVVAVHSVALTNKPAIVGMRPIVAACTRAVLAGEPEGGTLLVAASAVERLRDRVGPRDGDAGGVLVAAAERIAELERAGAERDAQDRVLAATRAGKVPPVLRDWALCLARTDPQAFETWAASAPVVVAPGRIAAPERCDTRREQIVASARASYRAEPALALITSEAAWIEQALRDAGVDTKSN